MKQDQRQNQIPQPAQYSQPKLQNHQNYLEIIPIIQHRESSENYQNLQKLNPVSSEDKNNNDNSQNQIIEGDQQYSTLKSKWNRQIQGQRKGRFNQQEQRALSLAIGQFLTLNQITYEEFQTILNEKNIINKILKKNKFFNFIANVLPNRSMQSCYRYLRRSFNNKNRKGKWTIQEQKELLKLINIHGKDWSLIGKLMDRTNQNIYDKYRSIGADHAIQRKKCTWSLKQLVKLLSLVNKQLKANFLDENIQNQLREQTKHNLQDHLQRAKSAYNTSKFKFHNLELVLNYITNQIKQIDMNGIKWSRIASSIKTRSHIDCKNKFIQILDIIFKSEQQRDYDKIISFIEKQKANNQQQIDWSLWDHTEYSAKVAKNKYLLMKNNLIFHKFDIFSKYLEQLRIKLNQKYKK